MWYLVCWDRVVWLDCREACLQIKFLVRTAFNKQASAYVHGVKTHGKTGFGADESREAEVRTTLWMHFSPIGAVISWKKQRGLPKSMVDHCHDPYCVGKSFPKPSDWTWPWPRPVPRDRRWLFNHRTLVKLRKFADFWPSYFIHWPSSVDPDTDSATNQSDGFTVSHPSLPSFVNKNGDPARVDS